MPLAMRHLRTLLANRLAKRRLQILLFLVIPTALFFFMRARLSWRPRVLGQMPAVRQLVWSPNGKYLAVLGLSQEFPDEVLVFDVARQHKVCSVQAKIGLNKLMQFSPNGQVLYALDERLILRSWSVLNGQELKAAPVEVKSEFGLSPDCSTIVQSEYGIVGRRVSDGKTVWALNDSRGVISLAQFSSDGKKLAVLMRQTSYLKKPGIVLWNLNSASTRTKPEKCFVVHPNDLDATDMIVDFNQNIAYFLQDRGPVTSFDLSSGNSKAILRKQYSGKVSLAPDKTLYAASIYSAIGSGFELLLCEWPSGDLKRSLSTQDDPASYIFPTFSPDGGTLAAIEENNGNITLWRIK
jgi:Tol biopolymer transport system component